MNFLLLNPPHENIALRDNYCSHTSKADYFWAPSDLLYISSFITENHEIEVIDAIAEKLNYQKMIKRLKNKKYDIIISLTGSNTFESDFKILKELKEIFQCKVYTCGNIVAFEPEMIMTKYTYIDGILHNFFNNEITRFFNEGPFGQFESITFKENFNGPFKYGRVNFKNTKNEIDVPPPKVNLFPMHKYQTPLSLKRPISTMITSFGCPFSCKFCVASNLNIKFRSLKSIINELEVLKKNNIKEIFFMDSTFNSSRKKLLEICQVLTNPKYSFSWSCNIHAKNISYSDLKLMKKAGCHTIQIGVESKNKEIREEFAPSKEQEDLDKVFKYCKKLNIRTLGYFIIGFPNESEEDVQKTINYAIQLDPYFASFSTLVADYGTKFYEEAISSNYIPKGLLQYDNSKGVHTKNFNLSDTKRNELRKLAYKRFYLRPKKILSYALDFRNFNSYFKNGVKVINNYFS